MKSVKWITSLALAAFAMNASATVSVGDDCPNFSLKGSDGKTHKLSDYKGKKAVVIAWYPKAFTGG